MEHVFLGDTGVRTSRLAFGAMSFGGDADEGESARLFAACRDAGVNHFDCADVYAGGRSEEVLGRLAADCRDELILTTKAYFPSGAKGPNDRGSSRYHLVRAVEGSLRRLDTDRIDVFYLHRFDDVTALDETLRAVDDLVRAGKVLYPAVSNFAAWQVAKALGRQAVMGLSPLVAVQPMYNLLKRQAESEILPMAQAESVAVFPYSPLAGGLLSGKYGPETRPESGRVVDNAMYATRYGDPANFEIAAAFTELAGEVGQHPVTLAVAWVAAHPGVTAPLLGARNVEQLAPALRALDVDMTDALYDRIAALSPAPAPATDRNEESSQHTFGSR
jgi:aryl-alcohol dehydrogenase-like predicted oxidoreductase